VMGCGTWKRRGGLCRMQIQRSVPS
jgi:hypothetical protein